MDKKANEAYSKGDSKFFEDNLSDKFVMFGGGHRMTKADVVANIAKVKCEVKSQTQEDPQMSMIDADTYALSYISKFDGECNDGPGGKMAPAKSTTRSVSVWVRNGDKWQGVFHGENEIADASKPAGSDKGGANKEEPKKEDKKPVAMDDSKKGDDANPMSAKMASVKTSTASSANTTAANTTAANTTAANTAAAPKSTADANTDALVKLHTSGWEAWKAKDAAAFDKLVASNASTVDPAGGWHSGKADVIKFWTTMDCKDVTKVNFKDGFASAVSPTLEILTGTGSADGTCDGHKNGDLDNVAFYVKEGSDWKLAFMIESMHGKM
jgi:ketosteroid isomerase-like protein